jgi:GNAT superfamily N-acetyltransferase
MAPTERARLPDGIEVRDLIPADIDAGLMLSEEAGWNQTAEDWAWMIGKGQGWACQDASGRVVATALTQPQGDAFGWISMVLVTETWRRRGIAGFLMERSIHALRSTGLISGLDATPAGRSVYGPLGFRDIYAITRFRADRMESRDGLSRCKVRAMSSADLPAVTALDRAVFGADRSGLLSNLLPRAPGLAWVAEARDGFCLGRDGRGAWQLGPVVASDAETAIALMRAALKGLSGPVMIDVPDHHAVVVEWLGASGFVAERPYTRMLLDHDRPLDDPARVFAIAGPELG